MAAGRRTSTLASSTRFLSRVFNRLAIFARVVVLPAPCRPQTITTAGGFFKLSAVFSPSPIISASWRCTMAVNILPGLSASARMPSACVLTCAKNDSATGRATSASMSAARMSLAADSMFSSVSRPLPLSFLITLENCWLRMLSIVVLQCRFYYTCPPPPATP